MGPDLDGMPDEVVGDALSVRWPLPLSDRKLFAAWSPTPFAIDEISNGRAFCARVIRELRGDPGALGRIDRMLTGTGNRERRRLLELVRQAAEAGEGDLPDDLRMVADLAVAVLDAPPAAVPGTAPEADRPVPPPDPDALAARLRAAADAVQAGASLADLAALAAALDRFEGAAAHARDGAVRARLAARMAEMPGLEGASPTPDADLGALEAALDVYAAALEAQRDRAGRIEEIGEAIRADIDDDEALQRLSAERAALKAAPPPDAAAVLGLCATGRDDPARGPDAVTVQEGRGPTSEAHDHGAIEAPLEASDPAEVASDPPDRDEPGAAASGDPAPRPGEAFEVPGAASSAEPSGVESERVLPAPPGSEAEAPIGAPPAAGKALEDGPACGAVHAPRIAGEALSDRLVWLVAQGFEGAAARLAFASRAHGAVPDPAPEALWLAAASRADLSAAGASYQQALAMTGVALDAAPGPLRDAVLMGALAEAAILDPDLVPRARLRELGNGCWAPALADLREELSQLGHDVRPRRDDLARLAGRDPAQTLRERRDAVAAWRDTMAQRNHKHQASTTVLHRIAAPQSTIGAAADAVARGAPDAPDLVADLLSHFGGEADWSARIEAQVHEIEREMGRPSRDRIRDTALRWLQGNVVEGLGALRRWRDAAGHARGARDERLRPVALRLAHLLAAAADEAGSGDAPLAGWLSGRLRAAMDMVEGRSAGHAPSVHAALIRDLDRFGTAALPRADGALRLNFGADPDESRLRADDARALEALMGGVPMEPAGALADKVDAGALEAARRLLPLSGEGADAEARIDERGEELREAMTRRSGELQRRLRRLQMLDVDHEDEIAAALAGLDALRDHLAAPAAPAASAASAADDTPAAVIARHPLRELGDAGDVLRDAEVLAAAVRAGIDAAQRHELEQLRAQLPDRRAEVEALLARIGAADAEPLTLDDAIAAIRGGEPLPGNEAAAPDGFERFFPAWPDATGDPGWPADANAFDRALAGDGLGGLLRVEPDLARPARELMGLWWDAARALARGGIGRAQIEPLLKGFDLAVSDVIEARAIVPPGMRDARGHLATIGVEARGWFLPPAFGSRAGGPWNVVSLPRTARPDAVTQAASDRPTILLLFGVLSAEERRQCGITLRSRNAPALLIDGALCAFLATRRERARALFDCALPFAHVAPYDTSSGKLPPEMFFGRGREIGMIESLTADGCLVYGGRQLGKSALLHHVQGRVHDPRQGAVSRVVGIDIIGRGGTPPERVWVEIARALAEDQVTKVVRTKPEEVRDDMRRWLDGDPGRRILLLLDEADRFIAADLSRQYANLRVLRDLMQDTGRRFKVVLAGLHNVQRAEETPNSPLAHLGRPVCVGPLRGTVEDKREARRLVTAPMRAAGLRFEGPEAPEDILAHVNYYPSLAQIFCKELQEAHRPRPGGPGGDGPLWTIPGATLFDGDGYARIGEAIGRNFDLTLSLDARYKLVANVLGLVWHDRGREAALDSGLEAGELLAEAGHYWPDAIERMRVRDFGNLLDEMVDLGVLGRSEAPGRRPCYALRSALVANMLGERVAVEDALQDLLGSEPAPEYDPATYRRRLPDGGRSPLTDAQINRLVGGEPGPRLVIGLAALGLAEVPAALGALVRPGEGWGGRRDVEVSRAGRTDDAGLRAALVPPRRGEALRVVLAEVEPGHAGKLLPLLRRQPAVIAGTVRPILLLRAEAAAARALALSEPEATEILEPWSDAMVQLALEEGEASVSAGSDLRAEILRLTGGAPRGVLAACAALRTDPEALRGALKAQPPLDPFEGRDVLRAVAAVGSNGIVGAGDVEILADDRETQSAEGVERPMGPADFDAALRGLAMVGLLRPARDPGGFELTPLGARALG